MTAPILTQSRLKELLTYDPDTGIFVWILRAGRGGAGCIAGSVRPTGYRYIGIDRKNYRAHRLAWLYVYGKFPDNQIDHKNRKRDDNWIGNLRDVTTIENCKNQTMYKNNTSGIAGVRWHKGQKRWHAQIVVRQKNIYLGSFLGLDEAVDARAKAEIIHDFRPNHGTSLLSD